MRSVEKRVMRVFTGSGSDGLRHMRLTAELSR
jgi:hypothetical protein